MNTIEQCKQRLSVCRSLFEKKNKDYGSAWRILRPSSLTDQIYIKAKRIQTIEIKGTQCVEDSIIDDLMGIINYSIMALLQLDKPTDEQIKHILDTKQSQTLFAAYDAASQEILDLLQKKNHDYGEAWRNLRVGSMVDIILMKLLRIRQIESNQYQTSVSENVASGYQDVINYALFCWILLEEE